jgi:adenine-specific DNA-methyltransferase
MPTIQFSGKAAARQTDQTIPRHQLIPDPQASCADQPHLDDNLIIHGDNLPALKALLPAFAGRVKCVYIDPPYNTGNTGWAYGDNAGGDGRLARPNPDGGDQRPTRHDHWLRMLLPRLGLLHEMLREDGAIFVSIDDHEMHRLRMLLDEVFGESNFVSTVIWQKIFAPKNSARLFSADHEYIVVYARNRARWSPRLLPRTSQMDRRYKNPDSDSRGAWASDNLTARNYYVKGQYEVTSPSGKTFRQPVGTYWRISPEKFRQLDQDGRIWWGPDGGNMPRLKRFLAETKPGAVPRTLWPHEEVGHTQDAKRELLSILDFERPDEVFVSPKPTTLIKRILQIATDHDSIVLDAFAGSGTTGHATLALNSEDGGNRRFILVEQEDYARTLTAERMRRVIAGVPGAQNRALRAGYGGTFSFFRLGPPLDEKPVEE